MSDPRRVHVVDADGRLVYTRLLDDGSALLVFDRLAGCVDRATLAAHGWAVRDGWPPTSWSRRHEATT